MVKGPWLAFAVLMLVLGACELRFGAQPTATPAPTATLPPPMLAVVWVQGGSLMAWREDDPTPRMIAEGAVIEPYFAPDGRRAAFTRGAQGDAISLWAVGLDGAGEQQLVMPDVIPSIRNGHPQINQVGWLDAETVYFNTRQRYDSGSVNDDNLYRVRPGAAPQLILPPDAGGVFALSPDGQQIAVVNAGLYDMQKGRVTFLDGFGVEIADKLNFTALSAPTEPPFYLPLAWNAEGSFARVPVPNRDNDRVALWRVPVEGEAQIFGYISSLLDGLPVWSSLSQPSDDQMLYLRGSNQGAVELVIASANGENSQVYTSNPYSSGGIARPRWLTDGEQFAYEQNGAIWIGRQGEAPRQVLDVVPETLLFAGEWAIYVNGQRLYVMPVVGGDARLLADGLVSGFDAALVTPAQPAP